MRMKRENSKQTTNNKQQTQPHKPLKHHKPQQPLMIISYPDIKPKIKSVENREMIFCTSRKKWVVLNPEEWVRQNFLLYLIHTLGFSSSIIAVEKKVKNLQTSKRFDIIVYKNDLPYILVECKEMNVVLGQSALTQTLNYFSEIQSRYIIITNGNQTFAYEKSNNTLNVVDHIET
jgi:hypothetical protein